MPNAPNSTKRSRLQAAGWVYVEGWVPPGPGTYDALEWVNLHWEEAARIANTPQERGRPRKGSKP
jgi:hypothetical protein